MNIAFQFTLHDHSVSNDVGFNTPVRPDGQAVSDGRLQGPPRLPADTRPHIPTAGAIPADAENMPDSIDYDAQKQRLLVGQGYVENVEPAVWLYEVSGKQVLLSGQQIIAEVQKLEEFEREEGVRTSAEQSFFERNPALARRAKEVYGCACQVCGFDFVHVYGEIGRTFAEVHHLNPLSEKPASEWTEEVLTKISDVAVLCPNCHRMVHRRRPALSLDELRSFMRTEK